MRVLFLDMDGVVNSARFFEVLSKRQYRRERGRRKARAREWNERFLDMIDPETIPHLNAIVEQTGCKAVLSSSWRVSMPYPRTEALLHLRGFVGNLIDQTPYGVPHPEPSSENSRGYEIQAWLDEHPEVESIAILDDAADMAHLLPRLVQTSWADGLKAEHVPRVVALLAPTSPNAGGRKAGR